MTSREPSTRMQRCPRAPTFSLAALVLALACGPIRPPPGPDAPVNACSSEDQCAAYAQAGATPVCNGGQCLVSAQFANLALVVSLPQDSPFAPNRTFVVPFDPSFFDAPAPQGAPPDACPLPMRCAWLPGTADITGDLSARPSDGQLAGWNLGNNGPMQPPTWLPVQATYRLMWPNPNGNGFVEASSLGLPVEDVSSDLVAAATPPGTTLPPGPNGGPSMVFQALNVPTGVSANGPPTATYELTLMPVAPLDQAFPPDVDMVQVGEGRQAPSIAIHFDPTAGSESTTYPTFDITRDAGLDGWTAYLRDATTLRRISNLARLSGTTSPGVQLMTDHHPDGTQQCPTPDALNDAQLVIAPPAGAPVPTLVISTIPCTIPPSESYPPLPSPVEIRGTVVAPDGTPLAAQLVFDAIEVDKFITQGGALDQDNSGDLQYGATATAQIDGSGNASYAVTLPQGQYRLTISPLDTTAAVTIVQPFVVVPPTPPSGDPPPTNPRVLAQPLQIVQGNASVGDGRPLAGATVDVVPVKCFDGSASTSCMPRAAQTTTASDGSYAFGLGGDPAGLDPGSYILRVRPADGTRLPWVWQSIVVGPTPVTVAPIVVPAPAYAGLRLYDPASNPVINAVVRMYQVQPDGPAAEVARAITDTNGDYDMYLAPPAPTGP